MRTVFLDTVGLIALWDRSDQWHGVAVAALAGVSNNQTRLVTTSYVLAECGNAASRRPYRTLVDDLRATLDSGGQLVIPTTRDWAEAWAAYGSGPPGDAGVVDHLSFLVMRRLQITAVFTNDRHFKANGFEVLF